MEGRDGLAGEKFIALEETSQEIKAAVDGVKTDVAGVKTDVGGVKTDVGGVQVDVDTVGTDLTTVKNNIGTPTGGKTVVSMINELSQSSGGNKKKFVSSTTNVLLSETINDYVAENETEILQKSGKALALKVSMSGELTIKIATDIDRVSRYLSVTAIRLNDKVSAGNVQADYTSPTNTGIIYVNEGDTLIFKAFAGSASIRVNTIQILGEIVNINNDIAFETLNGDYSSFIS